MKKILFLHGFFATGSCPMAVALKEAFDGTAVVLPPDLPLHPKKALKEEFAELEAVQFDHCNPFFKNRVWGLLVSRTPWPTSPFSSWSTTTKPSIPLAVIRLLNMR